ncbi:MAG TPA: hypothetical protein VFA32_17970 [Dehalococcoidia bacterium]|nr:hypothetical protein [Dehalococcoidia bacterium]
MTYDEVNAYLDNGNRSVLHEQRLEERAGAALTRYDYAVFRLLEQGMGSVTVPQQPREVVRTEIVYRTPPPAKSFLRRLFGG